jgi:hypothetical protein
MATSQRLRFECRRREGQGRERRPSRTSTLGRHLRALRQFNGRLTAFAAGTVRFPANTAAVAEMGLGCPRIVITREVCATTRPRGTK